LIPAKHGKNISGLFSLDREGERRQIMEKYQGIKFKCLSLDANFNWDERLTDLDRWVYIFAELGLAPVHPAGAYGNHSIRAGESSFFITRSGMTPQPEMDVHNYCLVEGYDRKEEVFFVRGRFNPSSESLLHHMIYRDFPDVDAIMHGHSSLLNHYALSLDIPITPERYPYGTVALARSAVDLLSPQAPVIILKEHGFVAMGDSVATTARKVLDLYAILLNLLKAKA
jgi:hypothetical protein